MHRDKDFLQTAQEKGDQAAKQRAMRYAIFFLLMATVMTPLGAAPSEPVRCFSLDQPNFIKTFQASLSPDGAEVLTSPEVTTRADWDQLIVSWNADLAPDALLRVEARAIYPGHATKFYAMGDWTGPENNLVRTSIDGQKDADGDVDTDTLLLKNPTSHVQIRLVLTGQIKVRFVNVAFLNSHVPASETAPDKAAWGKEWDVPQRSQLSYPGGDVWCSPTSVTMVMAFWAQQRHHPEWDVDVPVAAHAIYDTAWKGTGNWPFNTAYAGSFPGLHAEVRRFPGLTSLEKCIAQGIPPIVSVNYKATAGDSEPGGNGHLMVVRGFTKEGDVIVNDPWADLDKGQHVRKIFPRDRFHAMWAASHNTVYLIYPENKEYYP